MKTFYSILSAVLHPETGERVSIGLIMSDGNDSIFDYSRNRLAIVKNLLPDGQFNFIKDYLKSVSQISSSFEKLKEQFSIHHELDGRNVIINEPYIQYLSVYSENVLTFSKPVKIDLPVGHDIFHSLFTKLIDTHSLHKLKPHSKIRKIKAAFFPTVKEYFNEERVIHCLEYENLVIPITIDLFGKNEIPFTLSSWIWKVI